MVAQIVALVASGYSVIALVVIPLGVLAVGFIIGLSIWLVRRLRGTDFVQDVAADAEQLGLAAGAALMVSVVTAPPVRTFVNPLNMVRPSYWRNTHVAGGLVISPDGITFIRRGYARSGHAPEQFARIDIRAAGVGTLLGSSAALEVLTTAGQHSFYVTRKEAAAIEDALIACGIPLR